MAWDSFLGLPSPSPQGFIQVTWFGRNESQISLTYQGRTALLSNPTEHVLLCGVWKRNLLRVELRPWGYGWSLSIGSRPSGTLSASNCASVSMDPLGRFRGSAGTACPLEVPGSQYVNSNTVVSGQKTSKFIVSLMEESMAGHMGVNGVY
jgi:hypothetical protein